VGHPLKKNHCFNGIHKFIISFTKAKLMILILSWTNALDIPATRFSNIRLKLSSHSCLNPRDALFHSAVLIKMPYFSLFRSTLQVILISPFFYLTVLDVQINFQPTVLNYQLCVHIFHCTSYASLYIFPFTSLA